MRLPHFHNRNVFSILPEKLGRCGKLSKVHTHTHTHCISSFASTTSSLKSHSSPVNILRLPKEHPTCHFPVVLGLSKVLTSRAAKPWSFRFFPGHFPLFQKGLTNGKQAFKDYWLMDYMVYHPGKSGTALDCGFGSKCSAHRWSKKRTPSPTREHPNEFPWEVHSHYTRRLAWVLQSQLLTFKGSRDVKWENLFKCHFKMIKTQ